MMLVLSGAGLLLRSLWTLQRVDLGFEPTNVLTLRVEPSGLLSAERQRSFAEELVARVQSVPGVISVGTTSTMPFRGPGRRLNLQPPNSEERLLTHAVYVDGGYFETLRIPLYAGRLFSTADTVSSQRVVLLSESLARVLFPGESAVGRSLLFTLDFPPAIEFAVVGVVGDIRKARIDEPPGPALYVSRSQFPTPGLRLAVRSDRRITGLAQAIQSIVRSIDSTQPVEEVGYLDRIISDSIAGRRFYAVGTATLAGIALLLAAVGLYGVVARSESERARELALRIAMGAQRRDLIVLILRQSLVPVAIGIAFGTVLLMWLTRFLKSFLFEVSPLDVTTYAAAAALIGLAALTACLLPARRASLQDPLVALREG